MIDLLIVLAPLLLRLNTLLAITAAFVFVLARTNLAGRSKQTIARAVILTALTLPLMTGLLSRLIEPANLFAPPVQISQAPLQTHAPHAASMTAFIGDQAKPEVAFDSALFLVGLTFVTALFRARVLVRDRMKLKSLSERGLTLKRIGKTKIQISDRITIPFAARLAKENLVLLPPKFSMLALKHELQHHRQGDLQWNKLLEAARLMAGWNPLVRRALERIEEFDELACDENLLGRGPIDVERYARCLFETAIVAQTQGALAGTARMATSPHFLRRRIEMTLNPVKTRMFVTRLTIAVAALALGATAWTSEGLIKDRRITETQARKLVGKSTIPIVINRAVLEALNNATGTPRARFYMRNALKRMNTYRAQIEPLLAKGKMPSDLLAVALVESGYQNVETQISAGLWMFVPDTARRYGLQVDDVKDERLDVTKETEAAVNYLAHLESLFDGDWNLSLLSYNAGERTVQAIIDQTGERDVFKLATAGKIPSEENRTYVPKVMAALLILQNPSLVEN